MSSNPTSPTVAAKLDDTRRRLLDLSRRNRLLNHRTASSGTLRIVGEHPDEVFRMLVTEAKRMQFLAREEAPSSIAADLPPEETGQPNADEAPSPGAAFTLAPIDESGPKAEHQTDTRLQTTFDGERLQTRLLHLAREAASALEEQGTNILFLSLGTVVWRDAATSDASRAPLVFVPIELSRRSVNSRHTAARFDDDIVTNPCLLELCKRQFRLDLPVFDGEERLTAYFGRVTAAIASLDGWSVEPEIHLGLFSFAKLLMYRDLDPATWPNERSIVDHTIVQRLSGLDVDDATFRETIPDTATLDDQVSPDECYQVLDADSSQQAAILASKRGASAVVEGPPGTGKSQTITNVIAECLSQGRSVLFVAEKAAALDVVKRRLEVVGLGDFVLELHSRKASKRVVLDGLRRSIEADATARAATRYDATELTSSRAKLNQYVRELHDPIAALGLSPYEGLAKAVALADAPEARCVLGDVLAWTAEQYVEARDLVAALDGRLVRAGEFAIHPWHGVGLTATGLETEMAIRDCGERLIDAIQVLEAQGAALATVLGASTPVTAAQVDRFVAAAIDLAGLPAISPDVVGDPGWDSPGPELAVWLTQGAERARLRERWLPVFSEAAEAQDWRHVLERRRALTGSILRFISPSWYSDGKQLRAAFRAGVSPSNEAVLTALEALVASAALRNTIALGEARFAPLFGAAWRGPDGDWARLSEIAEALVATRQRVRESLVGEEAARRAVALDGRQAIGKGLASASAALASARDASSAWLSSIASTENAWYGGAFDDTPLSGIAPRIAGALAALERLGDVADVNEALARARVSQAWPFVEWAVSEAGASARGRLSQSFERHFSRLWIDKALASRPSLARFRGEEHGALVARFRALDVEWLEASKRRLSDLVRSKRPDPSSAMSKQSKLGVVQSEIKKQRNIMPLRKLFAVAGDVVQAITPCFMMSPISVAQYLQPGGITFDIVIFDEASQVEPADAYGAIARGRQLLLVGDEKQLPPTNFFSKVEEDVAKNDSNEFAATDLESILAVGSVRIPNRCRLRWHYRSRHSSLIEFSNVRFYDDAPLRIFPSPHTDREEMGLAFRFVEDGEYRRGTGQQNPIEAAAVAAEVVKHAREHPDLSLGVGAFSMPQQRAIQDEIERIRRDTSDDVVEAFIASHPEEPFFVKNLETIQGDERDVILLSVGYGPDAAGKMTMNFGPLNRDGGWRRLNVLVTRAKRRCLVFSSFRSDQMTVDAQTPLGVVALKDYLYYAEHGRMPTDSASQGRDESRLGADVAKALRARGWDVHEQVGTPGFAIDAAVVDPRAAGRYLLGIELDGATYRGSATARDRDRLRQSVLEGLGWKMHRVWSSDWLYRREATLTKLLERLEAAKSEQPPEVAKPAAPPPPRPASSQAPPAKPIEARPSMRDGAESENGRAGVFPYTRRDVTDGDHEKLVAMRPALVADILVEVVREEWPIHIEEAFRALAARFDTRVSKRTEEQFTEGLATAIEMGAISEREDFLWAGEPSAIRVRRRDGKCPVTKPELIAPEELAAAIRLVLGREFGLARESVASATAKLMGFSRTGPALATAIESVVDDLIRNREIQQDASGFLVLAKGTH